MNRREPIEKEQASKHGVIKITDQMKCSGMAPSWMHDQSAHGKGKPVPSGEKVAIKGVLPPTSLRAELRRMIPMDVAQPARSVFNIGSTRQNAFMSPSMGVKFMPVNN